MEIIRAFGVYTFVDGKLLTLFLAYKGTGTIRTSERKQLCGSVFFWRKSSRADLAQDLSFGAIVFIQVWFRGIAARTCAFIRDIAFLTTGNRLYLFSVAPFQVRDVIPVIPLFVIEDFREPVDFEFLVFRGMGIIVRPLFERNISANKQNQPTVHVRKVLNYI